MPMRASLLKSSVCRGPAIEKAQRPTAVLQLLLVHVDRPHGCRPRCLPPQGVLVQGQHVVVAQQAQREGIEPFHVATDQQRR